MTFNIYIREPYVDTDDGDQHHSGVAVTTRLPGVGALCPFATEHGVVTVQALTDVGLGGKDVDYLKDGLAVDDTLQALLNADDGRAERQLHGVGSKATFAFTGNDCFGWADHRESDACAVAGNLLTGEAIVDIIADVCEQTADGDEPLAKRLIDAFGSRHAADGDKRDDFVIQGAAVVVTSTKDHGVEPYYNGLRVDATETPLRDLRETFSMAWEGYEAALEKYAEA